MKLGHAIQAADAAQFLLNESKKLANTFLKSGDAAERARGQDYMKLSLKLGKIIDAIVPEAKKYNDFRNKLIVDYGTRQVTFSSETVIPKLTKISAKDEPQTVTDDKLNFYRVPEDVFDEKHKGKKGIAEIDREAYIVESTETLDTINAECAEQLNQEIAIPVQVPFSVILTLDLPTKITGKDGKEQDAISLTDCLMLLNACINEEE